MSPLSRRDFLAAGAACACGLTGGCIAINKAPTFEATADGSLPVRKELSEVGSQIKVKLPETDGLVLVWRSKAGLKAASITCTHRGSEVHFNPAEDTLDCPSHGSRFRPDGTVLEGPAKKPLRAYSVEAQADRLKIVG